MAAGAGQRSAEKDLVILLLWSSWLFEAGPGPPQPPAAEVMERLKSSLNPFHVSAQLPRVTHAPFPGYR